MQLSRAVRALIAKPVPVTPVFISQHRLFKTAYRDLYHLSLLYLSSPERETNTGLYGFDASIIHTLNIIQKKSSSRHDMVAPMKLDGRMMA